jgi:Outer membrane protein beta-barrel domain
MKKIAIIILLAVSSTFGLKANTNEPNSDSLNINIDKRTKTIVSASGDKVQGYSLLSDLRELFKAKNMTLTDSTWKSIREIINSESNKDTVIKIMQDGKQVSIAFDMKGSGTSVSSTPNSSSSSIPSSSDDRDWPRRTNRNERESVKIGWDGIHVKDGSDEVHISRRGVQVIDGGTEEVNIGFGNHDDDDSTYHKKWDNKHNFGSLAGFNVYLGLNNFVSQGTTAYNSDTYALKPFGSRYFSMGWTKSANITNGANTRLKIGIGVNLSWYNFMLENSNTVWTKGPNQIEILPSDKSLKKSKLTTSYIDVPIMPYLAFKKGKFIEHFGFGGYVGYRMGAHSKTKASTRGKKEKEYNNFYLNDFRYGLSLQLGINNFADLFVNYDLNQVFKDNKGPKVNGISFGIRL